MATAVGNLSFDTTEGELETLLSHAGQVAEVVFPVNRQTGRPRGFAFVEFTEESAALEAIEKFNEFEFNGRNLRVTQAEDRPPRRSRGFSGEGSGSEHRDYKKAKPKGSRRNIRARKRSL
jgi:RNA recognition motif-containing protein